MVVSISARGNAKAALAYYAHLRSDEYYTRGVEPLGRWAGEGAERLSLRGPVTQTEFEAALDGLDPKTGDRLAQYGGRAREHSAGWDMTFSAPKSVSVLWALSDDQNRRAVEQAHQSAVLAATRHLERTAAWARRGTGGRVREQTAGLLMAQFDHHTSRESDPQLHTHCFVFNLAPRRDGSWGAIVSRELYAAQKDAGAVYRHELAGELERMGHRLDPQKDGFRVAAIPREVERAFSKRRQAIEEAAHAHGYRTPKGMELATLRTRRAKRDAKLDGLFKAWQTEAKALEFELNRHNHQTTHSTAASSERSRHAPAPDRFDASSSTRSASAPAAVAPVQKTAAQLGTQLGHALRSQDLQSAMPGIKIRLGNSDRERERE
jgi:conjugative relaxase-like TrwC/TraI family protein